MGDAHGLGVLSELEPLHDQGRWGVAGRGQAGGHDPTARAAAHFHPAYVLAVEPERELRWLGRFLITGLFDGEHGFLLEAANGGTRLTQSERFSGIAVTLFRRILENTEAGFRQMNMALKTRVEQSHSDPQDVA